MPNKLTDKDIIKALECCSKAHGVRDCISLNCPLFDKERHLYLCIHGDTDLFGISLDLINRQKAEIEKWKALAENGASAIDTNNRLVQKFAEIKTEAIKEFGKRLKSRINDSVFNYWNNNTGGYYLAEDVPDEIDNLIDEMVGDNNAE